MKRTWGLFPTSYYDPIGMSAGRRAEFETGYAQQTGEFNFQEELLTYCQSDVELLRLGCEKFQEEFKSIIGANPM